MGIDVWEVIDAASTKPFGFMPFYPGPGLGGHCIPIDPFYLTWKAREYEFQTRFIELAGEVNTEMPRYVVERAMEALNARGQAAQRVRGCWCSASPTRRTSTTCARARRSRHHRAAAGARARRSSTTTRTSRACRACASTGSTWSACRSPTRRSRAADAVLIVTDHAAIDYDRVVERAPLVVDTRNACRAVHAGREKIVKA